jgi:hypothetical protein
LSIRARLLIFALLATLLPALLAVIRFQGERRQDIEADTQRLAVVAKGQVEHDKTVRLLAVLELQAMGCRVIDAAGGAEAMTHPQSDKPLDLLFTSGYTENAILHHARLDAGVPLLSKPYRRKELAWAILQALDRPPAVACRGYARPAALSHMALNA